MNYNESLKYIHSTDVFGSKPGLERISILMEKLDSPHKKLKAIHVAGTNGKGSTCTMIASGLIKSGKKVGLYLSPYVVDFRERIQINGEYIPKETFARLLTKVKDVADNMADHPTEFELITAVMFLYFAEEKVDYAVIEVGLGGRFDATNIVNPVLTAITKISLDHTAILGDSIEKIAHEKAGIIKNGVPVVMAKSQNQSAKTVIEEVAYNNNAPVFYAKQEKFDLSLAGCYQQENAAVANLVLKKLGISRQNILSGLKSAYIPARLERISDNPLVYVDGAHNPDGVLALAAFINNMNPVIIFGMMKDKDVPFAIKNLAPKAKAFISVTVKSNKRSENAKNIYNIAKKYTDAYAANDYDDALDLAASLCGENPVIICGSLYLASDIRELAKKRFNKTT